MGNYNYANTLQVISDYRNEKYRIHKYLKTPEDVLPEGYVFDENKSIKWNREQLKIENETRVRYIDSFKSLSKENNNNQAELDIIEAIKTDLRTTDEVSKSIYRYAYQEGHSSGLSEVFNYLYDILDVVQVIFQEHIEQV